MCVVLRLTRKKIWEPKYLQLQRKLINHEGIVAGFSHLKKRKFKSADPSWPSGLRRGSVTARLLALPLRFLLRVWTSVFYERCVLCR